jgi:tRNA nucleotidyltransferase (CCA-adding enzyme)
MRIYSVGGAVRDELLGLPVKDRDWVVVGCTPEDMERLGYRPVGSEFPVFLHPDTKEEYALARTERKVARGYRGFQVYASPEVTLEQDLARRDLTINAIARDESGALIDPFGGASDLKAGVLRHVSPAFAEDPVRILRVARFAARFGFRIAEETAALMRRMVEQGEADALVPERVWQEFARGLMERDPWRMVQVLAECGLLGRWLPELHLQVRHGQAADPSSAVVARALGFAAAGGFSLSVRFAIMTRGARGDESALEAACAKVKAPAECRDLALLAARRVGRVIDAAGRDAAELLALLEASDAFRRPGRLAELINVAEAESGRDGHEQAYLPRRVLQEALAAAAAVDGAAIAAQGGDIGARLHLARQDAIALHFRQAGRGP